MNITPAQVKELREKTSAGMMDCKAALIETKGDMEAAVDWLRKKGLAKAAQKAGRVAAEGLIATTVKGRTGAIVEVNSETDFVARNDLFQDMARTIATLALEARGDLAKLLALPFPGRAGTVDTVLKEMIATIGENMTVRRTNWLSVEKGVIAEYVHNRIADGLGKLGVLIALESDGDKGELSQLGRRLALHVAAANPLAVTAEELDPTLVEKERAIYSEQARASGKPAEIVAKMVEGRLRKEFFRQVVLLDQVFLGPGGDGKTTVGQVLKAAEKGAPIRIAGLVRYVLGEGIGKDRSPAADKEG
jgi:elongation factor Ts